MTLYARLPSITWGTSFANTITFGFPLDDWRTYSSPREGSVFQQSPSGVEDAWIVGTDYYLSGVVRWIPTTTGSNPTRTGWDGTTGWRAFLEWARQKNQLRFYPDASVASYITSYLVEPMSGEHDLEPNGDRSIRLTLRNTSSDYSGY